MRKLFSTNGNEVKVGDCIHIQKSCYGGVVKGLVEITENNIPDLIKDGLLIEKNKSEMSKESVMESLVNKMGGNWSACNILAKLSQISPVLIHHLLLQEMKDKDIDVKKEVWGINLGNMKVFQISNPESIPFKENFALFNSFSHADRALRIMKQILKDFGK